ncbi:MAG: peroxiredoxin [Chlamydiales bacterium]|jgi:peroxiredoxin (alkyl hydroperoxide reductase subunit C)|nr:peroxiredoxin [Chlamydiales bacterium]
MSRLLIGKKAPSFRAKAVQGKKIMDEFSLDVFLGQYVVLFFYPLDFTFVCPTELHAFQEALPQFKQRNAQVIGCSVDSGFSHLSWLSIPKAKGGIEGVEYPIISDLNKKIASDYGVLHEEEGIAYRGLFLIDRQGIIRHLLINDFPIGRSVEESLRILDALIYFEAHGEVCPANWSVGKKAMQPDMMGLVNYFS